ncbi:MAG: hypothetical protein IJR13_00050 [Bacteroidales bacterium]|nr:hypothetical protein [Bacteroidales bacterium]
MYRRFAIITLALLAFLTAGAQNGVNAPYSQYGFSQTSLPNTTPFAASMGGIVTTRSGYNYVNPFNPASYASIQGESFVFDISMSLVSSRLSDASQSMRDFDGGLTSIAIAFPIFDWWKTSLGLLPYSSTLYESVLIGDVGMGTQQVKTIYDGKGGISQFYWGNGFNIIGSGETAGEQSLQLGFNINYLRGTIAEGITYDFIASDTTFFVDTRRQSETDLSNVTFDLGALYRQPLNENYTLSAGLSCKLPRTMKVDDKAMIYTFANSSAQEYILDTIFPARGETGEFESTLKQPFSISVGLALERNHLWSVGLDFSYAEYNGMKYEEGNSTPLFGKSSLIYDNNYRIALGGGWLGDQGAPTYWGRMGFTGGVHYEHGKLCLELANGQWTLNEWGAGLGITFPMRKGRSQLVLTASYTNFGNADMLRSEIWALGITLSSNERWFVKRKYN